MHGWIHTRYMTLDRRIMTILNAGPPQSNTIMYDFRKRPGGPSGELLWFISDRDITSTPGRGDKTVMLAVPAQSPALQSEATVMNRRPSECAVPTCPLSSLEGIKMCFIFTIRQKVLMVCFSKHAWNSCKWASSLAKWCAHTISKQSCLCPFMLLLWASLCFATEWSVL